LILWRTNKVTHLLCIEMLLCCLLSLLLLLLC
jgi:hypothetical protein